MIALLLFTLFCATALLAAGSLLVSWQRYGGAVLAIRGQLRDCSATREVRFSISEAALRPANGPQPIAKIYRPNFKPAAKHALRAAA